MGNAISLEDDICKNNGENLRQTGYLNIISNGLDTVVKIGVVFFLNPILVSTLGASLFGVWQIINQMNSYMTTVDLRSGTSLKWYVARNRTILADIELQRGMTAGLLSNVIFLPVYIIAGIVLVWLAPSITNVDPVHTHMVRLTIGLLVIAFIIDQYAFLFQSILVGMNLSYKNVGIRVSLTVLGGMGTFLVVYMGYGLPGMAKVAIGIALLSGIINLWIVKKFVQWFGFAQVNFKRIKSFFGLTLRFMVLKTATLLSESTDLILLGFFAGPKFVAAYVITRYMIQAFSIVLKTVQSSIAPGLGSLVGEGNVEKLVEARKLLIAFNWFSITSVGCVIVLWNRLFISTWVTADLYVGTLECLLIVLIACFNLLKGIDGSIIIMSLDIKRQATITGIVALLTIFLSSLLIPLFQTLGLLLAVLVGEIALSIAYSLISQKLVHKKGFLKELFLSRKAIAGILLMSVASYAGTYTEVGGWASLAASLVITGLVFMVITWFASMSKADKDILRFNIMKIKYLSI
jgi:O-antigen/teichoic acid export membrane protein